MTDTIPNTGAEGERPVAAEQRIATESSSHCSDMVVDLGSGGGFDYFLSAQEIVRAGCSDDRGQRNQQLERPASMRITPKLRVQSGSDRLPTVWIGGHTIRH